MVCPPRAAVLGSRTRVDAYNRSITTPLTGEPDAGDPPVRFGGRGKVQSLVPTPIGFAGQEACDIREVTAARLLAFGPEARAHPKWPLKAARQALRNRTSSLRTPKSPGAGQPGPGGPERHD